jgi:rhamnosyltransferase
MSGDHARGAPAEMDRPLSVSILLLIKNHLAYMRRSLDVLQHQAYSGPVEIVYVDSGSTDGTMEFMRGRGIEAHRIPPEEFHHARTRNLAASLARHEILVLLSADAIPINDHWLAKLVDPFQDPEVGGVYGKQVPPEGTGPLRAHSLANLYPDDREVRRLAPGTQGSLRLIRFSNANSAIRAEVWKRFRFHERVLVAEDHWVCYNILKHGMKVVYEPEAAVVHGHERRLRDEFRWAVDNAVSLRRMGVFDDPVFGGEFRYGLDSLRKDWAYFTGRREYGLAVQASLISAVKWIGVQLGKREDHLPRGLLRRISGHRDKL